MFHSFWSNKCMFYFGQFTPDMLPWQPYITKNYFFHAPIRMVPPWLCYLGHFYFQNWLNFHSYRQICDIYMVSYNWVFPVHLALDWIPLISHSAPPIWSLPSMWNFFLHLHRSCTLHLEQKIQFLSYQFFVNIKNSIFSVYECVS